MGRVDRRGRARPGSDFTVDPRVATRDVRFGVVFRSTALLIAGVGSRRTRVSHPHGEMAR